MSQRLPGGAQHPPHQSQRRSGVGAVPRTVGALDKDSPGNTGTEPPKPGRVRNSSHSICRVRGRAWLGEQSWILDLGGLERNLGLTIVVSLPSASGRLRAPFIVSAQIVGGACAACGRGFPPPKSAHQHVSRDLHQARGKAPGGGGGFGTEWGCSGWARPPMLRKGLSPQEPPQHSQGLAWAPAQGFTVPALPGRWGPGMGRCLLQWAWRRAPSSHPPGRAPGRTEWEAEAAKGQTGLLGGRVCRQDWEGTGPPILFLPLSEAPGVHGSWRRRLPGFLSSQPPEPKLQDW